MWFRVYTVCGRLAALNIHDKNTTNALEQLREDFIYSYLRRYAKTPSAFFAFKFFYFIIHTNQMQIFQRNSWWTVSALSTMLENGMQKPKTIE